MSSISESVHALLADQIAELQLTGWTVERKRIAHVNGSEFTFAQLRHNVQNFKGAEAVDICWVEEAANVSKASWDILIPTIRKEGSEIWISFNPVLETDATYTRFVLTQRPDAIVRKLSYRDNPWFPKVLDIERRHLLLHDPVAYAHVWEGECRSTVEGAIYAKEMKQAEESGRITEVPYDPMTPVQTVWDLGFGDKTAIWFVQPVAGWLHFIDYYENSGETIEHYVRVCQSKPYIYAEDWLPHDGVDTIIHGRLAGDRSNSIEQIMRALNRKPRIVPKMLVSEGINAARMKFPICRFDRDKCYEGLRALRMYQWGPPAASGIVKREPLHDDASHSSDAFRMACIAVKTTKAPPLERERSQSRRAPGGYSPFA